MVCHIFCKLFRFQYEAVKIKDDCVSGGGRAFWETMFWNGDIRKVLIVSQFDEWISVLIYRGGIDIFKTTNYKPKADGHS